MKSYGGLRDDVAVRGVTRGLQIPVITRRQEIANSRHTRRRIDEIKGFKSTSKELLK